MQSAYFAKKSPAADLPCDRAILFSAILFSALYCLQFQNFIQNLMCNLSLAQKLQLNFLLLGNHRYHIRIRAETTACNLKVIGDNHINILLIQLHAEFSSIFWVSMEKPQ